MNSKAPQLVCVGELTAPHGVRGLVRLRSFTENPDAVFTYQLMRDDGAPVKIEKRGVVKEFFITAIDGVTSIEGLQNFRNVKLYTNRAALPAAGDDEYYLTDLKGLSAQTDDGKVIGTVAEIFDFGAGTVLEIKRKSMPSLMLPFTDEFVPNVRVREGVIDIVMPIEIDGEIQGEAE